MDKVLKYCFVFCWLTFGIGELKSQDFWQINSQTTQMRPELTPANSRKYVDLDKDGDPDLLRYAIRDTLNVIWIDDDDDMTWKDLEGDTDSDCLIIDKVNDGFLGGPGDLIFDWIDEDGDQKADLELFVEQTEDSESNTGPGRPEGHYMWSIDSDGDGIMHFINWRNRELKAWDRHGISNFYEDYHGKSIFMKVHAATFNVEDLTLNWENPFLFYDPDNDGLTEYTIRFAEQPKNEQSDYELPVDGDFSEIKRNFDFKGNVNWAAISYDMDNDNGVEREFDFDFTVRFGGKGFNYSKKHRKHEATLHGLKGLDSLFYDSRIRNVPYLVYANHEEAPALLFDKGEWESSMFIFDEDDDCQRWERVELYEPLNPFISTPKSGGISHPSQSDVSGDRAEWDKDNSGNGDLYISPIDGMLHLHGAEWGAWRIDQDAKYYQGWGGWQWAGMDYPKKFPTILYYDTDNDGFFDEIQYDLDGDTLIDQRFKVKDLGLKDDAKLIDLSELSYDDVKKIFNKVAEDMWSQGLLAIKFAESQGLNMNWYNRYKIALSTHQKYSHGFWLQFYTFLDLKNAIETDLIKDVELEDVQKAYYQQNWEMLKIKD